MSAAAQLTLINKYLGLIASCLLCVCAGAQTPQVETAPSLQPTEPATVVPINGDIQKPSAPPKAHWAELSLNQQRALAPLYPLWSNLSEPRRKKWLAISKNFANLPQSEQIVMHSRMAEWASLTPQQRTQARLNFGETNKIPLVEKKAQWEAYLSLSDEEKRKLSDSKPPLGGAAPAQRSVTSDKFSHVQPLNGQAPVKGKTPGVKDLDQKTLLPPTNKASPAKLEVPAA